MMFKFKQRIFSAVLASTILLSTGVSSTFAEYTRVQQYYISGSNNFFGVVKQNNVGDPTNATTGTSTVGDSTSPTGSGEYLEFWYDDYYKNLKTQEKEEQKTVSTLLDQLKGNFPVGDSSVNMLSRSINKIYSSDSVYYVLGVKFTGVTYFKFGDNYLVLLPYKVSGNKEYFETQVKNQVKAILEANKDDLQLQYKNIQALLNKWNISSFVVGKVDTQNVKLYLGEQRGAKIALENQPFFVDKYYKVDVLDQVVDIKDTDLLVYTIIDKSDLEKANLASSSIGTKIQPFIEVGGVQLSLDYLNDSTYKSIGKNGSIKVVDYGVKKNYIVEKSNTSYYLAALLALVGLVFGGILCYLYYQTKYKSIFMKIAEGIGGGKTIKK